MLEFIKQSKKRKLYCILGILYLLCIIFVANDAWLYSTPIAKLTKVEIQCLRRRDRNQRDEGEKI